uniref:Cell cycle associated protein 1 n=1 Tax=Latimeria chalumnae TaxID=7897 RepID=H3A2C9_LATCH
MPSVTSSSSGPSTGSGRAAGAGAAVAAGGGDAAPAGLALQTEAMKQILGVLDKKLRNLEKKKGKLDDYQDRMRKGERLNQDQLDAVSKYQEVATNLEFARELQKSFLALGQDIQQHVPTCLQRWQLLEQSASVKLLDARHEKQSIPHPCNSDLLGNPFRNGFINLNVILERRICPKLNLEFQLSANWLSFHYSLCEKFEQASLHLWDLLEGKDKPVVGTTYKALKEVVERIFQSGYLESVQNHQNGVCEEEETTAAPVVEEQVAEAGPSPVVGFTLTFYKSEGKMTWSPVECCSSGSSENKQLSDDKLIKHLVQILVENKTTVSLARPCFLANRNRDLLMVLTTITNRGRNNLVVLVTNIFSHTSGDRWLCPKVHEQHIALLATLEIVAYLKEGGTKEAVGVRLEIVMGCPRCSNNSGKPCYSPIIFCYLTNNQSFLYSGFSQNSLPLTFSVSQVFNMNAPVPPVNEQEALKQQATPYQTSYTQGFSSQPPHQVEQPDLQQEALPPVVGTYHASADQPHPVTGSHQQPAQQSSSFPRPGQSFYNSRGVPRGGQRTPRGMMNGYRGPSNGFRGGYDGYRPSFSNTPNSGYGQSQFNTPRDYSNSSYQRDGYQQNFKRGSGQGGARGAPRGRGGAPRSTRGMLQ